MTSADLTTLESFQEYQQLSGSAAAAQQSRVQTLITIASSAIMEMCGQRFAPVETATHTFRDDGSGVVSLAPYPLQSATAVTTDDADIPLDDVRFSPVGQSHGVYDTMYLPRAAVCATWREVAVTGTWGYSVVPDAVRDACNLAVGFMLSQSRRQGDALGDSDTMGSRLSAVAIPGIAKRLLAPYRRFGVGA